MSPFLCVMLASKVPSIGEFKTGYNEHFLRLFRRSSTFVGLGRFKARMGLRRRILTVPEGNFRSLSLQIQR